MLEFQLFCRHFSFAHFNHLGLFSMKWRQKALFMRTMAALGSETAYRMMQKAFGRLSADPMARIPTQVRLAQWLSNKGHSVEGKVVFEVGTGNLPVVPMGFF